MVSKMVLDREKLAKDLTAWAQTHTEAVAEGVVQWTGTASDPAKLCKGLAAHVSDAVEEMVRADEAHTAESADDESPRIRRDASARETGDILQQVRDLVSTNAEDGGLAAVGLQDSINRDPYAIARVGKRVLELVEAPRFSVPTRPGIKMDLGHYMKRLKAPVRELTEALRDVDREASELQATKEAKDAAIEAFDERFVAVSSTLRGLATVAGHKALADRLPVLRKSPRSESKPGTDEAPEGLPGAAAAPGPA